MMSNIFAKLRGNDILSTFSWFCHTVRGVLSLVRSLQTAGNGSENSILRSLTARRETARRHANSQCAASTAL